MSSARVPVWGDPAPYFFAATTTNPRFHFDSVAGRYVVLSFFESAGRPESARIIELFHQNRARLDETNAAFFGVSVDPEDQGLSRVRENVPALRCFWDFDRRISRLYGACGSGGEAYRRFTLLLDERLRVAGVWQQTDDADAHVATVIAALQKMPPLSAPGQAPVLVVPRLFEPELCRTLMQYYDRLGGMDSGFMREINGKTVEVTDHAFKKRRDQEIEDEALRRACMVRVHDRLLPEIFKAFQYRATRIERYIVACYEAEAGGYFHAHRDNTTQGTAHRRFAVSLNLNTGEYEGGNLRFPEFGPQTYAAPAGGAVVFSCSLLHEATPITSGKRYAFLPFLYDDAAAQIRQKNAALVETLNPPAASNQSSP